MGCKSVFIFVSSLILISLIVSVQARDTPYTEDGLTVLKVEEFTLALGGSDGCKKDYDNNGTTPLSQQIWTPSFISSNVYGIIKDSCGTYSTELSSEAVIKEAVCEEGSRSKLLWIRLPKGTSCETNQNSAVGTTGSGYLTGDVCTDPDLGKGDEFIQQTYVTSRYGSRLDKCYSITDSPEPGSQATSRIRYDLKVTAGRTFKIPFLQEQVCSSLGYATADCDQEFGKKINDTHYEVWGCGKPGKDPTRWGEWENTGRCEYWGDFEKRTSTSTGPTTEPETKPDGDKTPDGETTGPTGTIEQCSDTDRDATKNPNNPDKIPTIGGTTVSGGQRTLDSCEIYYDDNRKEFVHSLNEAFCDKKGVNTERVYCNAVYANNRDYRKNYAGEGTIGNSLFPELTTGSQCYCPGGYEKTLVPYEHWKCKGSSPGYCVPPEFDIGFRPEGEVTGPTSGPATLGRNEGVICEDLPDAGDIPSIKSTATIKGEKSGAIVKEEPDRCVSIKGRTVKWYNPLSWLNNYLFVKGDFLRESVCDGNAKTKFSYYRCSDEPGKGCLNEGSCTNAVPLEKEAPSLDMFGKLNALKKAVDDAINGFFGGTTELSGPEIPTTERLPTENETCINYDKDRIEVLTRSGAAEYQNGKILRLPDTCMPGTQIDPTKLNSYSTILQEQLCENGKIVTKQVNCARQLGGVCSEGLEGQGAACVKLDKKEYESPVDARVVKQHCTDNDADNEYTASYVVDEFNILPDKCLDSSHLQEAICPENIDTKKLINLDNIEDRSGKYRTLECDCVTDLNGLGRCDGNYKPSGEKVVVHPKSKPEANTKIVCEDKPDGGNRPLFGSTVTREVTANGRIVVRHSFRDKGVVLTGSGFLGFGKSNSTYLKEGVCEQNNGASIGFRYYKCSDGFVSDTTGNGDICKGSAEPVDDAETIEKINAVAGGLKVSRPATQPTTPTEFVTMLIGNSQLANTIEEGNLDEALTDEERQALLTESHGLFTRLLVQIFAQPAGLLLNQAAQLGEAAKRKRCEIQDPVRIEFKSHRDAKLFSFDSGVNTPMPPKAELKVFYGGGESDYCLFYDGNGENYDNKLDGTSGKGLSLTKTAEQEYGEYARQTRDDFIREQVRKFKELVNEEVTNNPDSLRIDEDERLVYQPTESGGLDLVSTGETSTSVRINTYSGRVKKNIGEINGFSYIAVDEQSDGITDTFVYNLMIVDNQWGGASGKNLILISADSSPWIKDLIQDLVKFAKERAG